MLTIHLAKHRLRQLNIYLDYLLRILSIIDHKNNHFVINLGKTLNTHGSEFDYFGCLLTVKLDWISYSRKICWANDW